MPAQMRRRRKTAKKAAPKRKLDAKEGGAGPVQRTRKKKRVLDEKRSDSAKGACVESRDWNAAPSIALSTGLPCAPHPNWHDRTRGTWASKRRPEMDCVRLAGTIDIELVLREGKSTKEAVTNLQNSIRTIPENLEERYWNIAGEGGNIRMKWKGGFTTMEALLAATRRYKGIEKQTMSPYLCKDTYYLKTSERWMDNILWTLYAYTTIETSQWDQPLMRVVIPLPYGDIEDGSPIRLRLHLYFSRLIFFLIADDALKMIFDRMTPVARVISPVHSLPSHAIAFKSTQSSEVAREPNYAFTMAGLLKAHENMGYSRAEQPKGILLDLKEYQLQTLSWMQDQEKLPGMGLNSLFWEERAWGDGGSYYYFPEAGELRLKRPPTVRGGLLCEEMGLGKTVEMAALIAGDLHKARGAVWTATPDRWRPYLSSLSNLPMDLPPDVKSPSQYVLTPKKQRPASRFASPAPPRRGDRETDDDSSEDDEPEDDFEVIEGSIFDFSTETFHSASTLVIAPLTLVRQWIQEMKKCAAGTLTVDEYPRDEDDVIKRKSSSSTLSLISKLSTRANVVVTSYQQLSQERRFKVLQRVRWRRVILDEMQEIRSSTTELARACRNIKAEFRWMVSGTPLYTSISDLNGELAFLGVQPFCLSDRSDGFWGARIGNPWKNQEMRARELLDVLLRGVMIRHSKSQTTLDGQSILQLPPFAFNATPVRLTDARGQHASSHLYIYKFMEELATTVLKKKMKNGSGVGRSGRLLARTAVAAQALLRLMRETCISPMLLNGGAGCESQISTLNIILRNIMCRGSYGRSGRMAETEVGTIPVMSVADALRALMMENHSEARDAAGASAAARGYNRFRDARAQYERDAMVRYGANVDRNHIAETKRHRAVQTVHDRLNRAEEKIKDAEKKATEVRQRSWYRVRIVDMSRSAGGKVKVSVKSTDDNPGAAHTRGSLPTTIDITRLSTKPLGGAPERALSPDEISALVAAAQDTKGQADVQALAACISEHNQARKSLRAKQQELQKLKRQAKKSDKAVQRRSRRAKTASPQSQDAAGAFVWQRETELREVQTAVKRADAKMRELKTRLARTKAAGNKRVQEQLLQAQKKAGLDLIARPRRAKRLLPVMRWQWAVDKITSERKKQSLVVKRWRWAVGKLVSRQARKRMRGGSSKGWPRISSREAAKRHRFEKLETDIYRMLHEANIAEIALQDLRPYRDMLHNIMARQLDGEVAASPSRPQVTQSGFKMLDELVEGKKHQCSICLGTVEKPTFTRCVHLFCAKCLVLSFHASRHVGEGRHGPNHAPCPVCRRAYSLESLICVKVDSMEAKAAEVAALKKAARKTAADAKRRGNARAFGDQVPRYSDAITAEELVELPPPNTDRLSSRNARFPALNRLFITHMQLATGLPLASKRSACPVGAVPDGKISGKQEATDDQLAWWSPKAAALVESIRALNPKEKVVVFSQYKRAILHCTIVLQSARIPCVRVVKGDKSHMQHTAVHTFNQDPDCRVLLLHAGPAAAGLTLTVARHVIMLEPFAKAGEEAQALNRCHRIGQSARVSCQVLYYQDSVEERMLAFRKHENQFRGDTDHLSILPVQNKDGTTKKRDSDKGPFAKKIRYLFGIAAKDDQARSSAKK